MKKQTGCTTMNGVERLLIKIENPLPLIEEAEMKRTREVR